jgi:hypothetical protein
MFTWPRFGGAFLWVLNGTLSGLKPPTYLVEVTDLPG